MFKALFLAVSLASAAQPAVAQSIFDGFGEPQDPETAELKQWKRVISRQIFDHTPNFTPLGRGRATVNFCVDAAGRVVKENLGKYSGNAHALLAASVVSSLKLPPAPPAVKAEFRKGCYWFQQEFWFK